MKNWAAEKLICPDCLPAENSLELAIKQQSSGDFPDDILEGELNCPACGRSYPIRNGTAFLLPQETHGAKTGSDGYDSFIMQSAYLWAHFEDLLEGSRSAHAYRFWSSRFEAAGGHALDIGCAVGRLSFELSRTHDRVIGVDTSPAFISRAREIACRRQLEFEMIVEGRFTSKRHLSFDNGWNFENVDFLVADALALPFRQHDFAGVAAVNILEKVPDPLKHLKEVNRVLCAESSVFLFSDPFSWDPAFSPPELWLGGSGNGSSPYSRRGIDTVRRLFAGEFGVFDPPLEISDQGNVSWSIRKTENLREQITSQFLVGCRRPDSS